MLSIYFLPRDESKPDSDNSSNLEPERVEARGNPVSINAPTKNLTGQGERLEYNIKTSLISLDGGPEVFLRQGPNEIRAAACNINHWDPVAWAERRLKVPAGCTGKWTAIRKLASKPAGTINCISNQRISTKKSHLPAERF